jgi:hypothetical protein
MEGGPGGRHALLRCVRRPRRAFPGHQLGLVRLPQRRRCHDRGVGAERDQHHAVVLSSRQSRLDRRHHRRNRRRGDERSPRLRRRGQAAANGADGRMAGFRSTGSSAEKRSSSAAPRELSTVVSHPSRRPECEACPSSDPMFGAPAIEGSLAQRTQVHSILDTPGAWRPRFLLVIEIQSKSILTDVHHDAYMTSDIR